MAAAKVEIYTKMFCGYCYRAKRLLDSKHVDYVEYDITMDGEKRDEMRARAIEASAYVVAAAQVGQHEDGRRTFGHSLVVDPWGEVLLDMGGETPGLGFAEIDAGRIAEVRAQLPSLANKREIPRVQTHT